MSNLSAVTDLSHLDVCRGGELGPVLPVILVKRVFNGLDCRQTDRRTEVSVSSVFLAQMLEQLSVPQQDAVQEESLAREAGLGPGGGALDWALLFQLLKLD